MQVAEDRQQRLQEMDAVHRRFQQILQKKDDSCSALKVQLQEAQALVQQREAIIQQQRGLFLQLSEVKP